MKALPSRRVSNTTGNISSSTRMDAVCVGAVDAYRQD